MNDPLERTKVVLRHLPPPLTELALTVQIDCKFYGRYKWFCFRSGKNSQRNQQYTQTYIDFRRPEDVLEFAEFFDGLVFVNEKGLCIKSRPTNDMPVGHGEIKHDTPFGNRSSDFKSLGGGRGCHPLENGAHRHAGRHESVHFSKELDNSANTMERTLQKRPT